MLSCGVLRAQSLSDTVFVDRVDTVLVYHIDTVLFTDTIVREIPAEPVVIRETEYHTDTVYLLRVDTLRVRYEDTAALSALREKETFYREILTANGLDKEKLEAERNHYVRLVDSLSAVVRLVELENVRKEEANKYLAERAKAAEERAAITANKKKKVRPIQGIALRFFRTPDWDIRLTPEGVTSDGAATYTKVVRNRNAGDIEFDFVTGASVMLWDLTKFFNEPRVSSDSLQTRLPEIPRFDQQFNYDLGFYVGFGGTNLFKNFYIGPSFRFVDFFYLTMGVNICEYEVLIDGYEAGQTIPTALTLDDITAKSWLVKPFISFSIDLDFLSYIKK